MTSKTNEPRSTSQPMGRGASYLHHAAAPAPAPAPVAAQATGKSNRALIAAIPLSCLVAFGLWTFTATDTPVEEAQVQIAAHSTPDIQETSAVTPQPNPIALEQARQAVEPSPEAPVVAVVSTPAPVATPSPIRTPAPTSERVLASAGCEASIAIELAEIYDAVAAVEASWDSHRAPFHGLVQKVLNCPETGLDVTGSLDLVDQNLADLKVSWDGEAGNLNLRAIGVGAPAQDTDATGPYNLNFVLR